MKNTQPNYEVQTVDRQDWMNGRIAPFVKSLFGWSFLSVTLGMVSFVIEHAIARTTTIIASAVMGLGIAIGVSVAVTIRRYRIKNSEFGWRLHDLNDAVRNDLPTIARGARGRVRSDAATQQFWSTLAAKVAECLSVQFHNREGRTGCLIWLKTNGNFCVVGRGGQITTDAAFGWIPDDANSGIVRRIKTRMRQTGVFIINSVSDALEDGDWTPVGLENLGDVKSIVVVPVNGPPSGDKPKRLLGMLMITVDRKRVVHPIHVEHLKAMADQIATYALLTEGDEVRRPMAGLPNPEEYVRIAPKMDFFKLFDDLQAGQTLYWLDTFCPSFESWVPNLIRAVGRGAHIRMLALDPDCENARNRAAELASTYGTESFLSDLRRFINTIRDCKSQCIYLEGSLTLLPYHDLLGAPTYIVCDESDKPLYGFSADYLCDPSVTGRHFCWTTHHRVELESRLRYAFTKWDKNNPQMRFEFSGENR
jgi:hypothetical protein